jgi:hypothetical protein
MQMDSVLFLHLEAEDLLNNFNSYRQILVQNLKIYHDPSFPNNRPSQSFITISVDEA